MTRRLILSIAGLVAWALLAGPTAYSDDVPSIPAGSTLQVRLITTLSTGANQNGDPWMGKVIEPIFSGGQEVVPAGSTVEGRVTYVKPPGRAKGVAEMRLVMDSITTAQGIQFSAAAGLKDAEGANGKVSGEEGTIKGSGKSKKDAAIETGVGAGAGAGVGAITAGGSGALYGMGIGAAAAVIHNALKRHKEVIVPQGTELTFQIPRDTPGKKITKPNDTPRP